MKKVILLGFFTLALALGLTYGQSKESPALKARNDKIVAAMNNTQLASFLNPKTISAAISSNPALQESVVPFAPFWFVYDDDDDGTIYAVLSVPIPGIHNVRNNFYRKYVYRAHLPDNDDGFTDHDRNFFKGIARGQLKSFETALDQGTYTLNKQSFPGITEEFILRILQDNVGMSYCSSFGGHKMSSIDYVFIVNETARDWKLDRVEVWSYYPIDSYSLVNTWAVNNNKTLNDFDGAKDRFDKNMRSRKLTEDWVFGIMLESVECSQDPMFGVDFNNDYINYLYCSLGSEWQLAFVEKMIQRMMIGFPIGYTLYDTKFTEIFNRIRQ
jgi:hypothetical protein